MKNTLQLVRCGNLMAAAMAPGLGPCATSLGLNSLSQQQQQQQQSSHDQQMTNQGSADSGSRVPRRREVMLRGYINHFTSGTTAHGLNRVNAEQSWVRMVWVGIVLTASLGAIVHTTKQVKTYLQYPVSSTNRQEPNSFEFPDLTFCDPLNKRFFHKSMITYASEVGMLDEAQLLYGLVYSHFRTESDWRKERRAIELIYNALEHVLNITDVNIRPMDVVLYCTFDGEPCSHHDFQVFYHRVYTNCFTFKPSQRSLRSSGMDRGLFLLLYVPSADVNLKLDSLARLASGLENNGIRFQIHQRDTIPHPLEYGIMAPTGTLTAVGLEQVRTSLADTPTHPCIRDTKLRLFDNQFDFMRQYDRQLFDCIKHEYLMEVSEQCGCTLESHVIAKPGFDPGGVVFCHDLIKAKNVSRVRQLTALYHALRNGTEPRNLQDYIRLGLLMRQTDAGLNASLDRMLCADSVSESAARPELCYDSCNYNKYEYSLSQCPWPEDSFEVRNSQIQMVKIAQMLEEYRQTHENASPVTALVRLMQMSKLNTSSCLTQDTQVMKVPDKAECHRVQLFVRRSVVQLRVYPETLTVRHTIEERSYELVNLCSELGGILGLWIGFSIVTLFEFAELFIICASYYWYLLISKLPKMRRSGHPLRIPKPHPVGLRRRPPGRRGDIELIAASAPTNSASQASLTPAATCQNNRAPSVASSFSNHFAHHHHLNRHDDNSQETRPLKHGMA